MAWGTATSLGLSRRGSRGQGDAIKLCRTNRRDIAKCVATGRDSASPRDPEDVSAARAKRDAKARRDFRHRFCRGVPRPAR